MKQIKLIISILIFTFGALSAQTEFRPGYVVKSEGDTLFGEINYRDYIRMGNVCVFRQNNKSKKTTFYPKDILAYRFVDGKFFVTKMVNGQKVFLEYLIKGKLNMYHYRDNRTDHFYFEKDSVPLTELPYEDICKRDSFGDLMAQKNNKYVGILNYYLKDASGIQSKIESIKRLERKNLISLAEYYHNAVCDGEKCIIYEKKMPATKLNLEVLGGVFSDQKKHLDPEFYNIGFSYIGYSITYKIAGEVIARICMPSISENIYFKTGISYYGLNGIDNYYLSKFESSTIFFPFQFEYVYRIGIFEPRIALGIDYFTSRLLTYPSEIKLDSYHFDFFDNHSPRGSEFLITLGANINITKHLGWSVNYNISSINSFTTGLLIKL